MTELIDSEFEDNANSDSIVAYQYSDLQKTARAILAKATETANQKIAQAKKNIYELEEKMRQQGYDKGFAQGVAQGEIEGKKSGELAVRAEFEAKVGGLNGALQTILGELNYRKQSLQAQAESDLLILAIEIAKKIVRREVLVDENFVVPIMHEAVALTNNKSDLVIRANPQDHQAIQDEIPTLEAIFNDIGRVSIIDDASITQGGVKVASREGEVDMSLEVQFDMLEKALIGDTAAMREWDGRQRTQIPVEGEAVQEAAPAVPSPLAQPAAAVVSPATPAAKAAEAEDVPKAKPPVEPVRRRGPRARKNQPEEAAAGEASTPVAEKNAAADPDAQNSTVQAPPDPAFQSSLSGITSLSALTLGGDEEAIIKEVLGAEGGEQNG